MKIFSNNKKYKKFIIKSDGASWVLDEIKYELERLLKDRFSFFNYRFIKFFETQCIFFLNKYNLLNTKLNKNKIGISIFHIDKKQHKQNKQILKSLKLNNYVRAIQVTNQNLKKYLLKNGVSEKKIFKIPIGIDIKKFSFTSIKKKIQNKKKINLEDYLTIASFQKDGEGWGDGMVPKKIKGPDVFIKIIKKISKKQKVHVFLTGPARGYVKKKLKESNISFSHYFYKSYDKVINLFSLIDIYLVSSRVEGGPRAILESMASGTVIFSTRVGQSEEIIKNNQNGFLYDEKNIDSISDKIIKIYKNHKRRAEIIRKARETSLNFSYFKIKKKWVNFFKAIQC